MYDQKQNLPCSSQAQNNNSYPVPETALTYENVSRNPLRKVLDDKYYVIKTIGQGRYAKVKLAININTRKQVAVKIMRTKQMVNKKECLECLFTEINILTECRHPNVVKILDASFDGIIRKEQLIIPTDAEICQKQDKYSLKPKNLTEYHENDNGQFKVSEDSPSSGDSSQIKSKKKKLSRKSYKKDEQEYVTIARKTKLCYYVMKLAEYGELYKFIEHSERFEDPLSKYIFNQLIEGVGYLHRVGIVHRDIKPENLLINKKGRLIIADFSFAQRLKEIDSGNLFCKKFDPNVELKYNVGSEIYNSPEIWDNEISLHEAEEKIKNEQSMEDIDYAYIDGQLRQLTMFPKYNGEKSDIFACGATLFMMYMQSPPFRKAISTDPYYKRLSSAVKQNYWKIFKNISSSPEFRELSEKTLQKYPNQRYSIDQIKGSQFFESDSETISTEQFIEEIQKRYQHVEPMSQTTECQYYHETEQYYLEVEADEDFIARDMVEFQELREQYITKVEDISKMLKHNRNMKKIKKECFKNMIAGPSLLDMEGSNLSLAKQTKSQINNKKDSILSQSKLSHKNSLVGPAYNSDSEDVKYSEHQGKTKQILNREAKSWQHQFDRQSSHDHLN